MNNNTKFLALFALVNLILISGLCYRKYTAESVVHQPAPPPVQQPIEPEPEPEPTYTFEDAVASITASELKKDLEYIASDECGGRSPGSAGYNRAADYWKKRMTDAGLQVMEQPCAGCKNVFAWLDGENKNEIVVVGAHMDHLGQRGSSVYNGADDNGSGTVALLEIAQACAMLKDELKRTIVFQAYTAEERGLVGSRYYCNNPMFPEDNPDIKKHIAMINLDMIGRLGRETTMRALEEEAYNAVDLREYLSQLSSRYSCTRVARVGVGGGSDHSSFRSKGVPVVFFHTGTHGDYHRPSDTVDKINYEGMEQISKLCFELAWMCCQEGAVGARMITPDEGLPTHDHDHPDVPFPVVR